MSPTSYQTAPPRRLIISAHEHQVKHAGQRVTCERRNRLLDHSKVPLPTIEFVRSVVQQHQSRTVHRRAGSVTLFFMSDEQQDKTPQTAAVLWARYSQIAFIIPAAVMVGLLVGKLLDYWFHTRWLFLVGVILGAIAGFVELIRTVTRDKGLRSE